MDSKSNVILPDLFNVEGMSPAVIRYWNELQKKFSQEGFTVIEFFPEEMKFDHWCLFLGGVAKKGKNRQSARNTSSDKIGLKLNENLRRCFEDSSMTINLSFWNKMEKELNWKGGFIPIQELIDLSREQLELNLILLKLKTKHFPFIDFLSSIKGNMLKAEGRIVGQHVIASWVYLKQYINFLIACSDHEKIFLERVSLLFEESNNQLKVKEMLPSAQVFYLFKAVCEQAHCKGIKESKLDDLIKLSSKEVQTFFKNFRDWILDFAQKGFPAEKQYLVSETEQQIRNGYYDICEIDDSLISIQELLDNQSGHGLLNKLPPELQRKFGPDRVVSLAEQLKASLGGSSIIDRIKNLAQKKTIKVEARFYPDPVPFYDSDFQSWNEFLDEELRTLQSSINENFNEQEKDLLDQIVQRRKLFHFQNILNKNTGPHLLWKVSGKTLIPYWNLMSTKQAKSILLAYWEKREKEAKEQADLALRLTELYKIKSVFAINNYTSSVESFSFALIQEHWDQKVKSHLATVRATANYRLRRMREFGILEDHETVSDRKQVWLNEMLAIEESVKPYILYVKRAFQAALPVRRSVEFDAYRHSHDGVEFDPETVQNQDKWMNGEVMKTLRRKVDHGDVEQINAFALDSSGSMDHERMRNLFKLLYLLVLGLEDRKSYDAFHFFSTFFIETANFANVYTNRKLLFKILRRISTITKEGTVLYGGGGGTNISDAVDNCHSKIITFSNEIRKKDPEANVVCSLFVITDGEPSMGILDLKELRDLMVTKRADGNVSIKGIYIKDKNDQSRFVPAIFGESNYVETTDFDEAVHKFVSIMTRTYKEQRRAFKWRKKKQKLNPENKLKDE